MYQKKPCIKNPTVGYWSAFKNRVRNLLPALFRCPSVNCRGGQRERAVNVKGGQVETRPTEKGSRYWQNILWRRFRPCLKRAGSDNALRKTLRPYFGMRSLVALNTVRFLIPGRCQNAVLTAHAFCFVVCYLRKYSVLR